MRFSGTGIFTRRSMSIALSQASFFDILRCSCTASAICSPTVSTGLSEVIGSWKMIAMSLPRIRRISDSLFFKRFSPLKMISPASIRPGGEGMSRMIVSALTDLPLPDSPTMPSVEPLSIAYERPLTARTMPSSVLKLTRRSLTSSRLMVIRRSGSQPLNACEREQRSEKDERERDGGGEARDLRVAAETAAIRALHAPTDRPGKPFLLRRLYGQQNDEQNRRNHKDRCKNMRQPRRVRRQRTAAGIRQMLKLGLKLLLGLWAEGCSCARLLNRRRCGRENRGNHGDSHLTGG